MHACTGIPAVHVVCLKHGHVGRSLLGPSNYYMVFQFGIQINQCLKVQSYITAGNVSGIALVSHIIKRQHNLFCLFIDTMWTSPLNSPIIS